MTSETFKCKKKQVIKTALKYKTILLLLLSGNTQIAFCIACKCCVVWYICVLMCREVNIVDRKALNGSLDFTRSLIGLAKTYELKINGKTKLISCYFSVRDYKK